MSISLPGTFLWAHATKYILLFGTPIDCQAVLYPWYTLIRNISVVDSVQTASHRFLSLGYWLMKLASVEVEGQLKKICTPSIFLISSFITLPLSTIPVLVTFHPFVKHAKCTSISAFWHYFLCLEYSYTSLLYDCFFFFFKPYKPQFKC